MNKLIFLVGLPGSGKSTYANKYLSKDCEILSSDRLRKQLLKDVNNQNHNSFIFNTLFNKAKEFLKLGKNVVIDATNVDYLERTRSLKRFEDLKVKRIAIVFKTPVEECIKRDSMRERTVGENVIKHFQTKFVMPTIQEGFDEIIFID